MASKKRYVEYDLMRVLACLGVIMIHSAVFEQASIYEYNTMSFQAINFWGVLSRWAVPAFVMLSGMMILPKGDEVTIPVLFKHRVVRMMGAYVVWSAVYSFYNVFFLNKVYAGTRVKTFIDGCFSGETHMWYLPMLAGLYIASPILAVLIKKIDSKWIMYWLAGLFVFSSLIPFVVKLDLKFISVIVDSISGYMDLKFLGGWTLYFVLGYYIQQHHFTRKECTVVYISAIIGFAFTLWGTIVYYLSHGEALGVQPYEYPNILCYSMGVLLLFKEKVSKSHFVVRFEKQICNLSKLTFGIYLIHVLLLKILYSFGLNIQIAHPIISVPIVSIIVFVIGGCIIWCVRKIPVIGTYFA